MTDEIQRELDRAQKALDEKNEGMARACARRAAGEAIRGWLARQTQPPAWGASAVTRLRAVAADEKVPEAVRAAAARISATVSRDHTLPFAENPIEDALLIIRHFGY
ncbi:MAG: hypothetical protein HYZ49_15440 [Chloroflexi bacterium]|nr:hypothetical protein [Chloroflexota bacterium]